MNTALFEWSDEKNTTLRQTRNICFEDVVTNIGNGKLLDILQNPSSNHCDQYCLVVEIMRYAYIVPFVRNGDSFFLKTIYPSRKLTKIYIKD